MGVAGDDVRLPIERRGAGLSFGVEQGRRGRIIADDIGVVELVPPPGMTVVLELAIAKVKPHPLHRGRERQDTAHRVMAARRVYDLPAKIHHAATFRQDLTAFVGELGDLLFQGPVRLERREEELRITARQIEQVDPFRQVMIFQGREIEDLSKPFQTGDILPVDEIESLVAGDSHTQGAVGRFGLLHRLRQVGRAMVKKAIDVDRGLDRFGDMFDPSLTLKLLVECQSQMPGGYFQLFQSGKIAEAGRLRRLARLTQVSEMRFGSDLVENDPGNADVGIEMLEAIDQGSDRKGGRAGVDQQYTSNITGMLSELANWALLPSHLS